MLPQEIDTASTPIVDARKHRGKAQIRGAVYYDPDALLGTAELSLPMAKERPVAVYADDDERAQRIVDKLRASGFEHAEAIVGGIEGWRDAGLPTEELTQEQPIPEDMQAGLKRL